MSYFENFPKVFYKFGEEADPTIFQNIGTAVDVVDQIKDNAAFYQTHNILDGERPDQVSQELYNRPDLHWTFPLMNDDIRIQGWPLSYSDLVEKAKEDYPNVTINTRSDISSTLASGSIIEGATSGTRAKIIKKRLDLGQIIVERVSEDYSITQTTGVQGQIRLDLDIPEERFTNISAWTISANGTPITYQSVVSGGDGYPFVVIDFGMTYANTEMVFNTKIIKYGEDLDFTDGEVISTTVNNTSQTAVIDTHVPEYLSTHHFEDSDNSYLDIVPNAPFKQRFTYDFNLAGTYNGSSWEIDSAGLYASAVSDFEISPENDHTQTINLDDLQERVDAGEFQINGEPILIGNETTKLVNHETVTTSVLEAFGVFVNIIGTSDNVTSFLNGVFEQMFIAYGEGDLDTNGVLPVKFHSFFIIDNQLNIIDDTGVFSVGLEYLVGGETTYKVVHFDNGTQTTASPAPTSTSEIWTEIVTELETFIQANFDDLKSNFAVPVTFLERMVRQNAELRKLRVIKPSLVESISNSYQETITQIPETNAEVFARQATSGGDGNVTVSGTSTNQTTDPLTSTVRTNRSGGYY